MAKPTKSTLTTLANIFAQGNISYKTISDLLNRYDTAGNTATAVKEYFRRLYTTVGIDESYLFPFLNITPNQAKEIEALLCSLSPKYIQIKYDLSMEDLDLIISGNWSMPIKINNNECVINAELVAGHETLTSSKKVKVASPENVYIDGEGFDISSLTPIGKRHIKTVLSGSLHSPKKVMGNLLNRWSKSYDFDDWEDFIELTKTKPTFETFCEMKQRIISSLSAYDDDDDDDDDFRVSGNHTARAFSNGEVKALHSLAKEGVSMPYLTFFFNGSHDLLSSVINGVSRFEKSLSR